VITESVVRVQAEMTDDAEEVMDSIRPRLQQFILEIRAIMPEEMEEKEAIFLLIAGLAREAQELPDD